MKSYKVYKSLKFKKQKEDFPTRFKKHFNKLEEQLRINPYVNKPLGKKWFRENKLKSYRIYYLIYEDLEAVYLVAISKKKDQQKTINTIKLLLKKYRQEIEKIIT
ncbi:MAG: type II toxin-antitoxin system RelE/ParE family toxin [Nanoarchaeota archaeon]|nr:type II toxin-antitoxin system RelE/ParE family toxin [Nanoarchaeota archaeon]